MAPAADPLQGFRFSGLGQGSLGVRFRGWEVLG